MGSTANGQREATGGSNGCIETMISESGIKLLLGTGSPVKCPLLYPSCRAQDTKAKRCNRPAETGLQEAKKELDVSD